MDPSVAHWPSGPAKSVSSRFSERDTVSKNKIERTGELAWEVRALMTLPRKLDLNPSTHIAGKHGHTCIHTHHTYRQYCHKNKINKQTNKKIKNSKGRCPHSVNFWPPDTRHICTYIQIHLNKNFLLQAQVKMLQIYLYVLYK